MRVWQQGGVRSFNRRCNWIQRSMLLTCAISIKRLTNRLRAEYTPSSADLVRHMWVSVLHLIRWFSINESSVNIFSVTDYNYTKLIAVCELEPIIWNIIIVISYASLYWVEKKRFQKWSVKHILENWCSSELNEEYIDNVINYLYY